MANSRTRAGTCRVRWTEGSWKEESQSFISEINAVVSCIFSSEELTYNLKNHVFVELLNMYVKKIYKLVFYKQMQKYSIEFTLLVFTT